MDRSQIIHVYLQHSYNTHDRIGCAIRGGAVIFSESKNIEKHYGNLEYAIKQGLEKGYIRKENGILCIVPESKPHFQIHDSYDNLFIRRSDLNETERQVVEEVFSRCAFD